MNAFQVKPNFFVIAIIQNFDIVEIEAVPVPVRMLEDFGGLLPSGDVPSVLRHSVFYLPTGFTYIGSVAVSTVQFVDHSSSLVNRSPVL